MAETADAALRKYQLACFGTDLLDPEGQGRSLYQDDPLFVRVICSLKIRFGGSGYRKATRRAPFLNNPINVAQQAAFSFSTPGLW